MTEDKPGCMIHDGRGSPLRGYQEPLTLNESRGNEALELKFMSRFRQQLVTEKVQSRHSVQVAFTWSGVSAAHIDSLWFGKTAGQSEAHCDVHGNMNE